MVGQVFKVQQRVAGLGGPAPRSGGGGLLDHPGQFAQDVRPAQGVLGQRVGVVGRPRVVHRDPAEARQDPGLVHRRGAALGMDGEQAPRAGARAVHPL